LFDDLLVEAIAGYSIKCVTLELTAAGAVS